MDSALSDMASVPELVQQGQVLLDSGEWDKARTCFEEACRNGASPELLEMLGLAASMCEDGAATLDVRERAFKGYQEKGDPLGAARIALLLVFDYLEVRGSDAIANGWLQRARRLLKDLPLAFEHGLLDYIEGYIASEVHHDMLKAQRLGARTVETAEAVGSVDLEMLGRALEGYACVSAGELQRGMNLLDESTAIAVGGGAQDLNAIGYACCHMICACDQARDYDRAFQWCQHVQEFCKKWRLKSLFSYCQTRYAALLIQRGGWEEAEALLLETAEDLARHRPGFVAESIVHLADLRRRQGRLEEAAALFQETSFHASSLLGRAKMALDEDEPETAIEYAERFLRRHPPDARTERLGGIEILVQAHLALGQREQARETFTELEAIAELIGTEPVHALVHQLRGLLLLGEADYERARQHLSDAVYLYECIGNPYREGRARLELAGVLRTLGRSQRAEAEARKAADVFRELGAALGADNAEAFLNRHPAESSATRREVENDVGLTSREEDVLSLVAKGMSNQEVADELFLSVRTVERHLSNTYQKLGVSGKSARTAAVAHALKNGFV